MGDVLVVVLRLRVARDPELVAAVLVREPGAKIPTVSIRQIRNEPSAYLYGFLATLYPRRKNPPVSAWLTLSAKRSKVERSSGTALMDALSIVTLTVVDITDADDSGVILLFVVASPRGWKVAGSAAASSSVLDCRLASSAVEGAYCRARDSDLGVSTAGMQRSRLGDGSFEWRDDKARGAVGTGSPGNQKAQT